MIKYVQDSSRIDNNTIIRGKQKMDLSKELNKVIERLKLRVEKEIPDTGYFRNFAENFDSGVKPDFFGKNIALFIERDESRDGRAYLGVSVLHPQLSMDVATYIMNGDRNRILEYINQEGFSNELKNVVLELAESLKNK